MNQIIAFATILSGSLFQYSSPEIISADTTSVYAPGAARAEYIDFPVSAESGDIALEGLTDLTRYDSLLAAWQQGRPNVYDNFYNEFIDVDTMLYMTSNVPDSVYEARLKMIMSPVGMPYNHIVKSYIVAYTSGRRVKMDRILGQSQYYFPIIEEALDRHGLPIELRILPIVESALTPTAVSRMGATGLWQFMYGTGRMYGLEISSFIDQRRDPAASTEAACRFLKDLYGMYGDWTLVLAAYNCGPGNVNKAIKRAGGNTKNFWDIYPYLPKETRGYVPSFIAATYTYTFHRQHSIEPQEAPLPLATDTIMLSRPLHFKQITSTIGIPEEILRRLNPQYKMDIVPAVNGKSYPLTLPVSDIARYLDNEAAILEKDAIYMAEYLKPSNINPKQVAFSLDSFTYKVKSGDTLSSIAARHNVKVSQLMKWNNIKNANHLRVGQKLEIYR